MTKFNKNERKKLLSDLSEEQINARSVANRMSALDVTARSILFLLSILLTILTIFQSIHKNEAVGNVAIWTAVIAGMSSGLSILAYNTFKVSDKKNTWNRIADTYSSLLDEMEFLDPDKEQFLKKVNNLRKLG